MVFHSLEILAAEYQSLRAALARELPRHGLALETAALSYEAATSLEAAAALLASPCAIAELPLHTAARLLSAPERKGQFKVIGASYTFTAERPKVVVCHLSREPQRDVRRLLCTVRDSIGTQLLRYHAATERWDLPALDANTQELGSYARLLDVVETLCGSPAAQTVLQECAFVLSGQRVLERMEALAARHRGKLDFQIGYDLYGRAKASVQEALFGGRRSDIPDLPGTVLVANAALPAATLTAFMTVVDAWGEAGKDELLAFGMAQPHVGTPISVVGTVVFMEQMAQTLGHAAGDGAPLLPALDYDDFTLAPIPAKWLSPDVRREAVEAIHAATTHLLTSLMDAERDAAENFEAYFAPDAAGVSAAQRFQALRGAVAELAMFYSIAVGPLATVSGGAALKERIVKLRERLKLPCLANFAAQCGTRYGAALDVRELTPQVIGAAFEAIVTIKRQFRQLPGATRRASAPKPVRTTPNGTYLTLAHPDDARLALRVDAHAYASKHLTAAGKAPILRLLFHLLQHGEAGTRPLVREALRFDYVHDPTRRLLGRKGAVELKANTFYGYCQRLREFFPFIHSDHRGAYRVDYEAARHHAHPDDLARLRGKG